MMLKDKLCCKPVSRDGVEEYRLTRAELRNLCGICESAFIDIYSANYLYKDENDLFDCRRDFNVMPNQKGEQNVFLVQLSSGELFVVDTQGYNYARYVGRLVD